MAKNSKIEWCDHTFNPWEGCTEVSPGCAHCYAAARNARWNGGTAINWGKGAPRRRTKENNWRKPLQWNNEAQEYPLKCPECGTICGGRFELDGTDICEECTHHELSAGEVFLVPNRPRVFCASLADWLDDEVPIEWLADLLTLIHSTSNLDWLLLTKRPQNWRSRVTAAMRFNGQRGGGICTKENPPWSHAYDRDWKWLNPDSCSPGAETPPHNVWIGTTVEDQARADERMPLLLQIPAKIRFLSCEPLLAPVDLAYSAFNGADSFGTMPGIHWVICGGESGPGARPSHPNWIRSLRDQCISAQVPFLFKQWGEWFPTVHPPKDCEQRVLDIFGAEVHGTPRITDTIMSRVGKARAGRVIDGREWNQFPATTEGTEKGGGSGNRR